MIDEQVDDVVHPDADLTWDVAGRAMGATMEGPNRPWRAQSSTSRGNLCYTRRGRGRDVGESSESDGEEDLEEEDDVNDDLDVIDNFGENANASSGQQRNLPSADLLDDYDD